jgi:hypothetical protein
MASIKKPGPYNPQKATAYVGKGVLKQGGKITPVPNGPLVKKKGEFKGSTLKNGGKISCWKGYVKKGTKKKGGKIVNNCVKK